MDSYQFLLHQLGCESSIRRYMKCVQTSSSTASSTPTPTSSSSSTHPNASYTQGRECSHLLDDVQQRCNSSLEAVTFALSSCSNSSSSKINVDANAKQTPTQTQINQQE